MPEANAKDRLLSEKMADVLDGVIDRFRITGTIRKKNAVRIHPQHIFCRRLRWHYRHPNTAARKVSEDVRLDSEIVRDDMKGGRLDLRQRRELYEVHVLIRV